MTSKLSLSSSLTFILCNLPNELHLSVPFDTRLWVCVWKNLFFWELYITQIILHLFIRLISLIIYFVNRFVLLIIIYILICKINSDLAFSAWREKILLILEDCFYFMNLFWYWWTIIKYAIILCLYIYYAWLFCVKIMFIRRDMCVFDDI